MLNIKDPALWRRIKAKCAEEGITIKDKILALLREWLKNGNHMTRKKRAATNHFKKSLKRRLIRRFGGCQICGFIGDLTYNPLKTHHIMLVRDGGLTVPENCMILCRDCHTTLHKIIDNNPVDMWAAYQQLKKGERKNGLEL